MLNNYKAFVLVLMAALSCTTSVTAQSFKTSSFGKGINFITDDSTLKIKFHYRMQQLYTVDYDGDDWSSNALMRRSRIKLDGFALTPKLVYKVELGLTSRDMSVSSESGQGKGASRLILDAALKYQMTKHWQLWAGQTKLPGNRERVVSSANLQFVDRSNVNSKFTLDRDMGIQLHGKFKSGNMLFKPKFSVANGEGRDITEGNHGGLNYTARLDFLPFGAFEGKKQDYILSDLTRQSKPKLSIGVTYNQNQNAVRQQGQLGKFTVDSVGNFVENTLTMFEADLLFKYQGFSVLAEYAQTEGDNQFTDVSNNYNTGTGLNVQAGYLFKSNWEFAARYTSVAPDDASFSAIKEQNEYTLGISRYISGHNLKIQSDYGIIETVAASSTSNYRFRLQIEMQI
ncbi:MAG: phosphate-selective porin OprO/OprP [Bacteroidia bacterium]|jgi:phosphate-selective porin OprO/OprP